MDLINFKDDVINETEDVNNSTSFDSFNDLMNDQTGKSNNQLSPSSPASGTTSTTATPALSGYFNKLGVKGGIRSYKKRWFSYNHKDCKLYYFRGPDDVTPLGEVDIRKATFSLQPQFKESSFIIKIISNEKLLLLETSDRQVALHWFDTLQALRKQFIMGDDRLTTKSIDDKASSSLSPSGPSDLSSRVSSVFYDSGALQVKDDSNLVMNKGETSDITEAKPNRLSVFGRIRSRTSYLSSTKKESTKTNGCNQCAEYESQIINLTDDLKAVENELEASREVIKVLQLQLEAAVKEKESLMEICKSHSISEQMLHTLSQREKELALNESRLKQTENKLEKLLNESQKFAKERDEAKEQLGLMKELIQAKDQTVMSLTNEIYDLEKIRRDEANLNEKNQRKAEQDEIESLKDSVNAFQLQNKCLNKEIIALNEIRNVLEKKQQELQLKCYDWEARCCQIHSKLLSLLKELNQTIEMSETSGSEETSQEQLISANQSVKALVSRLLEESSLEIPLSWKPGNRKRSDDHTLPNNESDYDELGFSLQQPDFENEFGDKFMVKTDSYNKLKRTETSGTSDAARQQFEWKYRWDSFVGNLGTNELQKSLELKVLLRTGVPQEYRCKIWRSLINIRIKNLKGRLGSNYYQNLCQKTAERKVNPAAKQIELDLLRTLPNNKHFENIKSPGIMRLRQVLTCYSLHNPAVGYCQGMNRLAAVALLFMPEEDAFWCLTAIIENIMPPDYFTANLLGAHVDQYVLRDLLAEKIPTLHAHLEKHGIELSLFSWFLTCFVDNVPSAIYLRIWDVFLYEGNKVLFRFALAFLKYHTQAIVSMNDSLTINQYIRLLGYRTTDVNQLCHISFNLLNPFRMSKVKAKRIHYTQLVTSELNKLDQIRKTLPAHENVDNSDSD